MGMKLWVTDSEARNIEPILGSRRRGRGRRLRSHSLIESHSLLGGHQEYIEAE